MTVLFPFIAGFLLAASTLPAKALPGWRVLYLFFCVFFLVLTIAALQHGHTWGRL